MLPCIAVMFIFLHIPTHCDGEGICVLGGADSALLPISMSCPAHACLGPIATHRIVAVFIYDWTNSYITVCMLELMIHYMYVHARRYRKSGYFRVKKFSCDNLSC